MSPNLWWWLCEVHIPAIVFDHDAWQENQETMQEKSNEKNNRKLEMLRRTRDRIIPDKTGKGRYLSPWQPSQGGCEDNVAMCRWS